MFTKKASTGQMPFMQIMAPSILLALVMIIISLSTNQLSSFVILAILMIILFKPSYFDYFMYILCHNYYYAVYNIIIIVYVIIIKKYLLTYNMTICQGTCGSREDI